ncbi:3-deoxy-manno-octulosonate-8-phosphatase KdsC [Sedimenticola selenatireducens]|uniref:3-deoxy-D-manno-octulosonate 8-phosphate phosphatase KdsC n=1 Tax=Sedimenticola selenatireducens TaxID=191960 RepID=A0A557S0N7_9GAMM|nr:3-deoxy-manno-octulosonate-8-phosphatase KdsC [Sedimenticola selenatireducens]TVO71000.1 3-deoxy-manno-octulosonate-8-phosphatase KdsC [Sedimenticola selenatireducens]TVT65866.1 MAG: 3-deoxy-manno-octulosonate-8-phosphatase KdsC [Sedimenticola selenatireducens]
MQEILKRAKRIELIIFDVDGVLTDSTLYLGDDGQEYKAFNSKDGLGMKLLQKSGVEIGIITGRTSKVVAIRMESLGIKHVYQGQRNKIPAFETLRDELGLTNEQIAYVGDDVVDLPILRQVGLAIAVQDAHDLVKQHVHWQTKLPGGRGAAREICELILQAQGNLDNAFEKFISK